MELKLHSSFPVDLDAECLALLQTNHIHVPFLRPDYLRMWWENRGGGEWPAECTLALVTAHENGRLIGVAPLFHAPSHQGQPRLMLVGSVEITDYLDFVVAPGRLEDFTAALLPFLRQAGLPAWNNLDLYNVFDDSPLLSALERAAQSQGWAYHAEHAYHCPHIQLPGDWETYLAGIDKKQRHEIRRKMRRLEAAEVPSRWYLVEDPATLESEIDAFMDLMDQDDEKARFLTPPMRAFWRDVVRWAFQNQCLHMAFLEIDGQKAAAYLAFDYLNHLWVYNSGISRAHWEYSPGWVLLGYQLQWANEQHKATFDFMRGDEEYKYRFGGVDRNLLRVTLTPA